MFDPTDYIRAGLKAGCTADQMANLVRGNVVLQERQLLASAAARLCDKPHGPTAVGYGGARGGGKSHWLMAQVGVDDCQRRPGLKCLMLRKSGKANRESFDDLRQRVFVNLKHTWNATLGILTFENGSRIFAKHYQHEKDLTESFLGLEYDVIAIEEATTLTSRKLEDIQSCGRTSKPDWRPRIYSTTNPGGVGHDWYHQNFIVPFDQKRETTTRFIPARVSDNRFNNPEYESVLDKLQGWRRDSWRDGNWGIRSGQFFKNFRHSVHVIDTFNEQGGVEWFAAMDYGYSHYTVILLAARDAQDNIHVLDEYAARECPPARHCHAFKDMLLRHKIVLVPPAIEAAVEAARALSAVDHIPIILPPGYPHRTARRLARLFVGGDLFARQYDGNTIAGLFRDQGIRLTQANTNRVQGWAEILHMFGDPEIGLKPTLFIHPRCERLLNTLPYLQHDPDDPADVLKSNTDDEGLGGDDAADALRYLIATKIPRIYVRKLRGL